MRDPRVDPRVGDVVELAKDGTRFSVLQRDGMVVYYTMKFSDWPNPCQSVFRTSLAAWKAEHRTATVIHAEG